MQPDHSQTTSEALTVERLFAAPALTGELPSHVKFSPNGQQIAWLQVAEDDRERLDLWIYDIEKKAAHMALDASRVGQSGILSDAEKAERERRRQFTGGVTNFHWHPNSALIAAEVDGIIYLLSPESSEVMAATAEGTRQTDLKFSPDGEYLAFVRDYNLWLYHLSDNALREFTSDGNALRHYGLPEFIAQEEMHRFEGYWWSSDSKSLVFTRVDNSTVTISQRYEIDAEQFRVIEQRYPYAGATDARVELAVQPIDAKSPQWLDWQDGADDYLARVNCSQGDLYVQVQDRSQQRLTLKRWALAELSENAEILLTEVSDTWINLNDNFKPLANRAFLWTSARDGYDHLYLYEANKKQARQLTSGRGRVANLLHASQTDALFTGWFTEPTEQHLYRLSYGAENSPEQKPTIQSLTSGAGWHDVSIANSGTAWVDRHSSFSLPAELSLGRLTDKSVSQNEVKITTIASLAVTGNHPYTPYLAAHVTPTMGALPGADDKPLYYRLTEPRNKEAGKRYPVVVYVYGGPGGARVNWAWPPLLLQLFANHGFGVLELDNRGTGNRSKAFDDPIYLRLGKVEVEDQLRGVDFLRTLDWVDVERLGVFGHSYGGYMTVMCLAQAPEVFKAGVGVAPVSQWELYDTHYTERFLSTPKANARGYEASSVFPYLKNIRGELLLMHGMADDNVLFTHSTKLYKALQDQGIDFQMMTYPGSKHALHEQSVSVHRFKALFKFFSEKLAAEPN